jgi:putative FmdB family regulatory protein
LSRRRAPEQDKRAAGAGARTGDGAPDEKMSIMPTYEYACTACGERTEAKQRFDDPPLQECPHCGGNLRKLYSPVGIVFRGSGFYSTDARKGSGGDGAKKDEKAPAKEAPKADKKDPGSAPKNKKEASA